jgi:hypothetical protein
MEFIHRNNEGVGTHKSAKVAAGLGQSFRQYCV